MSRRTERVGSLIRETIGLLLLTKMSDPRIDPARTSVTRVDIAEDLLTAKVYVSVMGTEAEQRRTLRALRHAAGHLQELMTGRVKLRNTPALEFELDDSFKKALETYRIIEQGMEEIRQKEARRAEETQRVLGVPPEGKNPKES